MKLSYKISGIISFSLVSALAASVFLVSLGVRNSIQQSIGLEQQQVANQTLDKLDRFLYERSIDTQLISTNSEVEKGLLARSPQDLKNVTVTLNNIKSFDAVWDSLTLFDSSGKAVVSTDTNELQTKFKASSNSLYSYFDKALGGHLASTDLIRDPVNGSPTMIYFTPVRSTNTNSQVIGVMVGKLAWPAASEILKNIKEDKALLLNNKGIEIANSDNDNKEILAVDFSKDPVFKTISGSNKSTGSLNHTNFDNNNEPVLLSHSREAGFLEYTGNGWYLISSTPSSIAFAPIKKITLDLSAAIGGIMLLTLLVVLLFMRQQVVRPLKKLGEAAESMSRGEWNKHVDLNKKDELGQLASAFNAMTSRLSIASELLNQEKARLESSIKSLPLGFMLTDAKNTIITINPALHILIGLKKDADLNTKDAEVIKLLDVLLDQSGACLKSKKPITHNFTTEAGRFLRTFISPVVDHEKMIGTVSLIEDVTEMKVMERSKEEFFSIASHELRTPLTAIRGNADLIEEIYGKGIKDKDIHQMLGDIHTSSVRLIEIVNDFLDASRLEQGKIEYELEPFDITKVIENVMYEMAAVVKERKLYLKFDKTLNSLPAIAADEDRVKQVIYNLIGNAVKFTEQGGITVITKAEKGMMHITVNDTGLGIPVDKQALLFRKFQQAGNSLFTRDSTRGTGLGLYISKLLVEQMGGNLKFEHSEVGKGSTFGFTLPLAGQGKSQKNDHN